MRRTSLSSLSATLGFLALGLASLAAPVPRRAEAEVDLAEGLIALQAGNVTAALDWLSQAATLDPDAVPRRGLALLRQGRASEAAAEIEASLTASPREVVDDRGPWEGTVGLSAAADSNPNLLSTTLSVPAPGPGDPVVRGGDADGLGRVDLRLGIYPFHSGQGPDLGVTLETRRDLHFDFSYLDLGQARGTVQVAFGSDPQGFLEGPLGYARAPLGSDSRFTALFQAGGAVYHLGSAPYYQTLEGAAAFGFRETPATTTRYDLAYADRRFPRGLLSDPLRLGVRRVDRQAAPEFAETFWEGNGELDWPLGLRWSAVLEGQAREDRYDRPESNLFDPIGPRRHDTTWQTAAAVVWTPKDRLRWTTRAAYTHRRSNVDLGAGLPDLGYRRLVVSAGLSWDFL